MKFLKFRHSLVEEILVGRKIVTWRLFDDKNLAVGDQVELLDWESGERFADAEIISMRECKLGDVTEEDFAGHERYQNKEEMLKYYREYYGDRVTMDTPIKMIGFRLA